MKAETSGDRNRNLGIVKTNLLRNKVSKNAKKDTLYLLDLLVHNLKCTPTRIAIGSGKIFVNGQAIKGSSIYEILPFLTQKLTPSTLSKSKIMPKGSEEILRLLAETAASPILFPDPRIRNVFRMYREME